MRPRVPTIEEAETTLRAALAGVECDGDAVLAAQSFLELTAAGVEPRPEDLHITDESLPECTDFHVPDPNVPTTPEEAEAEPEPPPGSECDASRGGTLTLCDPPPPPDHGRGTNCRVIGEYTGPPSRP